MLSLALLRSRVVHPTLLFATFLGVPATLSPDQLPPHSSRQALQIEISLVSQVLRETYLTFPAPRGGDQYLSSTTQARASDRSPRVEAEPSLLLVP